MIPVEEAKRRITAAFQALPAETVSVADALGRVLAEDVAARVTQPWAPISAMDGYAVKAADVAKAPTVLKQIGSVPAGHGFDDSVGPGECVRIFTGAPLADGTDTIIMQEDTEADGDRITIKEAAAEGAFVRPAGLDFTAGDVLLRRGRVLTARDIGIAAAMNHPWLRVHRRPRVAILATGDEIVMPGDPIGPDQLVSSNGLALSALVTACGGIPVNLGIALDSHDSLTRMAAGAEGTDLLITTGGASVGEHDLIRDVLGDRGLELDFWKIAMRPGKPLMFGRIDGTPMLGLPGNPVSSMVCGLLFARPALLAMLSVDGPDPLTASARLGCELPENDRRQDYLRSRLERNADGHAVATPFNLQDSSVMSGLAGADCLVIRPPHAPAAVEGDVVEIVTFAAGMMRL